MTGRYSSAGLANGAADLETERTGIKHRQVFRPRHARDPQPFIIEAAE